MTTNETTPEEIAKMAAVADVPEVAAAWKLYQEARAQHKDAATTVTYQTVNSLKARWVAAVRKAAL